MPRLAVLMMVATLPLAAGFTLSNTLGDTMVLQRAPQSAVIYGFGKASQVVTTTFGGKSLSSTTGADGIWRMKLPPTLATKVPATVTLSSAGDADVLLKDVIFGDVILCSGQSNMQYTPHSMAGMNNASLEIAEADKYSDGIRFFTVGMETHCGDPKKNQTDCSKPFAQLNPNVPNSSRTTCKGGSSCRENWEPASSGALGGGGSSWNTFSSVCWLTGPSDCIMPPIVLVYFAHLCVLGKYVYDALGGDVPIGLISSNWGGTPIQVWQPLSSMVDCNPKATAGGTLYNSMIAPFTVGPMALTASTWYQGESNMGGAGYYACAFPSMIKRWRDEFQNPDMWFGFVQIAGFRYSVPFGNPPRPETQHSLRAGDLRQSQLTALALPRVGMTTAVDTGDWTNIHPPDKQNPSSRLAGQMLTQVYGKEISGAEFPVLGGSKVAVVGSTVTVTVAITAGPGGKPAMITTDAPTAATQSSTLNKSTSVPRTECITYGFGGTFAEDCGYPAILGSFANGTFISLNATAVVGADGSSIVLTASAPAGFKPTGSSYGRASWPRTVFFSKDGDHLPVIPWFANFSVTNTWTPPNWNGGYGDTAGVATESDYRHISALAQW